MLNINPVKDQALRLRQRQPAAAIGNRFAAC